MTSLAKRLSDWKIRNPGRFPAKLKPLAITWFRMSRHSRALPNFIVIGAPKCGTTSFFSYLSQHPQILPAMDKEPAYLRSNKFASLDGYRACFPLKSALGEGRITGEGTTTYLYDSEVQKRVVNLLPETQLFVLLRNPAERAISQYYHFKRRGQESRSIEDVFEALLAAYQGWTLGDTLPELDPTVAGSDYLKYGLYAQFLPTWANQLASGQLTHIYFESFIRNPNLYVQQAFARLGVDQNFRPEFRVFKAGHRASRNEALLYRLTAFYAPFNVAVASLLGEEPQW